jgi:glutathione S-transferase
MALAHKGLEFEPMPWRAVEKDTIARSGGGTVPVLVDGERWLRESWDSAIYLEKAYPNCPALFSGEGDQIKAQFIDAWTTDTVHLVIFRAVVRDLFPLLAEKDRTYYLERTKRKFGTTLEELGSDPEGAIAEFSGVIRPLQQVLALNNFLGGAQPTYGDYIVFGAFQWARVASTRHLVPEGSPVGRWFFRLLDAFDGLAAAQPGRDHWG